MLRCLAVLLAAAPTLAQALPDPQPPASGGASGATGATAATGATGAVRSSSPASGPRSYRLDELPVNLRLGVRVEAIRRGWAVLPTLVIVPDEASYVEAIGRWTLKARYPVLIDDGTESAREDIARFARAFKPQRTVRWSSGAPAFGDAEARRAAIERALCRVWSTQVAGEPTPPVINTQEDLLAHWKRGGLLPPGLVVADPGDAAWPAALAAAAGHAQLIFWMHWSNHVNGAMPLETFTPLADSIDAAAEKTGLSWRDLGDNLDAVTLCLNCPAKVMLDASTPVAVTDLLARIAEPPPADGKPPARHPREHGKRWAWCGQVFGNQAQSAYRAMAALFLLPQRAWLFDGYPDTKPWSLYDMTEAAKNLRQAGLDITLDDTPRNDDKAWRLRAFPGVDAGLILVNTKGAADEFNLEPGQCRPGDVPFLNVPAIVYMVHSFSAAMPRERSTVGGRWLERGAYAYLGSVHEPFLTAFVPSPSFAGRMVLGLPWAAAVRFDDTPPPDKPNERVTVPPAWKIATIGDPLITLGPAAPAANGELPLEAARDLSELLSEAMGARDFERAINLLAVLGRDQDAARVAAAVARDEPKAFTAPIAAAAVLPCFRAHDRATLVTAYLQLPADLAADGARRDALWHACGPGVAEERVVNLLRANLRPDQMGRDAADLAKQVAHFYGIGVAAAMLNDARDHSTTDYDRAVADQMLKLLTNRP
jgi:hypothetical protein